MELLGHVTFFSIFRTPEGLKTLALKYAVLISPSLPFLHSFNVVLNLCPQMCQPHTGHWGYRDNKDLVLCLKEHLERSTWTSGGCDGPGVVWVKG